MIVYRNEDEVDEAEILDKVSKATASAFNFKVSERVEFHLETKRHKLTCSNSAKKD